MKDEMLSHLRPIEAHLQGEKCLESILLTRGVWFQGRADSTEYPEAKQWKEDFNPKAQDCWYNAQMFCARAFDWGLENVRYFEGYVVIRSGIPPEVHGWVVMPDARVVDFSVEAIEEVMAEKGFQVDTRGALYVGVEIPIEIVVLAQNETEWWEPLAEKLFCGGDD
jgi:hypothetical protein